MEGLEKVAEIVKEAGEKVVETAKEVNDKVESIFPDFFKDISNKNSVFDDLNTMKEKVEKFKQDKLANSSNIVKCFDNGGIENEKKELKELSKTEDNIAEEKIERVLTIEEKQDIADKVAQEYNESKRPYERAKEKGIDGIIKTENGGVSFAETDKIYTKEDGTKCIVKIEATGKRSTDFDEANKGMGLEETPDGYVWHHVDDYNVKDGTITLELVEDEAHNAAKPHSGGCAQYDAVNGASYNPPRKGA